MFSMTEGSQPLASGLQKINQQAKKTAGFVNQKRVAIEAKYIGKGSSIHLAG